MRLRKRWVLAAVILVAVIVVAVVLVGDVMATGNSCGDGMGGHGCHT